MEIILDRRLIALDQNITSASQAIELSRDAAGPPANLSPEYITAMLDVYKDLVPPLLLIAGWRCPTHVPKGAIRTGFL